MLGTPGWLLVLKICFPVWRYALASLPIYQENKPFLRMSCFSGSASDISYLLIGEVFMSQ